MKSFPISVKPFGLHAILVEWPNNVDEAILDDILQFSNYLKNNCLDMKDWEMVPSYNSLTLIQRKKRITYEPFKVQLNTWYGKKEKTVKTQKYLWKLPVCYDLDFGIDLQEVSERLGKSIQEVIKMHTSNIFTVFGIGFLPGFMYLGGLPETLEVPRRQEPRLKVPKGAVGLAGKQTGVYPQESPGGWNIIGNCSVPIFEATRENPCLVNVGDKIQFYSIPRAEYELHKIEGEVGIYQFDKIKINA